jgi:hypothetical protein
MWEIKVRKAENGFVTEWWDELSDGEFRQFERVFEEPETELGELECMVNMLHFVKEYFGEYDSKHNKYNIKIEVSENGEMSGV